VVRQIVGGLVGTVVALWLGATFSSCSAEDPMPGGGGRTPTPGNFPVGTAGAAGAPVGGPLPGVTAGTSGGRDPFGNPLNPSAPMIGNGMPSAGGMCLQPTISFVIDGSGSMCAPFGGGTRWTELRKILLDPMNGLIYRYQNQVDFGVMLYDGTIDFMAALMAMGGTPSPQCAGASGAGRNMGECPQLRRAPTQRGNASAIDMMYPMRELGGSTPTDKAMNAAVDELVAARPGADPRTNPKFIILATDGQPNDICTGGLGGDGVPQQMGVVAAVERAYAAGIRTYVISLADGDPVLEQHLTLVAQRGDQMNPGAHTYSPATPDALLMDMKVLLGNALGCAVM
jgi:hypothetical protein